MEQAPPLKGIMLLAPDALVHERYRVLRELALEGALDLYEAYDQRDQRLVTLAVYKLEGAPNQDELASNFEREAQALAVVSGACLPAIVEYKRDGGYFYLVCEQVTGQSVAAMLHNGVPLAGSQVLRWADRLLADLAAMHAGRPALAHDQIRPDELVCDADDAIRLLGYRLGSAGDDATLELKPKNDPYAALERVFGGGPDARSDLYSLGAVLFHAFTGQVPPTAIRRYEALRSNAPDPLQPAHTLRPELPEQLSALLDRALAVQRKQRFASASELRAALAALAPPSPAPPPRPLKKPARFARLLFGLVCLLLGAMGVWLLIREGVSIFPELAPTAPAPAAERALLPISEATLRRLELLKEQQFDGAVRALAFSPNTPLLAVGTAEKNVLLLDLASGALLGEQHVGGEINALAFAPNGDTLFVALEQNGAQALPVADRTLEPPAALELGEQRTVRSLAVSGNGQFLACGLIDRTTLLLDLSGTQQPQPLFDATPSGGVGVVVGLAFLGDNTLVSVSTEVSGVVTVWSQNAGWGVTQRLTPSVASELTSFAVGKTGELVVAATKSKALVLWRIGASAPLDELRNLPAGVLSLDLFPDETLLAVGLSNGTTQLYSLGDGTLAPLPSLPVNTQASRVSAVRFSPAGQYLAVADDQGRLQLWGVREP